MYHSSTQRRYWTFRSEEELARRRSDANRKFRCKVVANGKVRAEVGGQKNQGAPEFAFRCICLGSLGSPALGFVRMVQITLAYRR